MRIRGMIGDWPVDLTLELDASEWAALVGTTSAPATADAAPLATPSPPRAEPPADGLWLSALDLVRQAGHLDGPRLLADLESLAGGAAAGKRLLVRLRHCPQIAVESGSDAPVYRWVG